MLNICYLQGETIKLRICIGWLYLWCPTGANGTGVMQNHKHIKHLREKCCTHRNKAEAKKNDKSCKNT